MSKKSKRIKIALVDDHILVRCNFAQIVKNFESCQVIIEALNGADLMNMIKNIQKPDLVLLDLCMPEMNGYETAKMLSKEYPEINVLILSMFEPNETLIELLKVNVKGIIKKNITPTDFEHVINHIMKAEHYYYSSNIIDKIGKLHYIGKDGEMNAEKYKLTENEFLVLKLSATELAWKEVAKIIKLSVRSTETIRVRLCEKFGVQNRMGLANIAFRNGLVDF